MIKSKTIIGGSIDVDFPELDLRKVPARVDTGARTSTIWASNIIEARSELKFTLFDETNQHYTGITLSEKDYGRRLVTSSNGVSEERYLVRLLITVDNRKIRALFTLANRSTQKYPILIGRNILRGKFIVDVKVNSKPESEKV